MGTMGGSSAVLAQAFSISLFELNCRCATRQPRELRDIDAVAVNTSSCCVTNFNGHFDLRPP